MRKLTINQQIEEIARKHLGVNDLSITDIRNLSVLSVKVALMEALKTGERLGYNKGYKDAKEGCESPICVCEQSF